MRSRRVYETVERPSVCPSHHSAADPPGLLLWARQPGEIDRLLHGRPSAAAAPQHGAQRQTRAVSRCQPTQEAEHRPVYYAEMQHAIKNAKAKIVFRVTTVD